jgi:hypothetical protein
MTDPISTSPRRALRAVAVLGAAAAVSIALTGCSAVMNTLEKVHEESFPDRAAAESGWVGVPMPSWLPADAVDIRTVATTNESNAVIAFSSETDLAASQECAAAERVALPFDARLGTLGDEPPTEVLACGVDEVAPVGDGWLAWFSAREEGETPETATR